MTIIIGDYLFSLSKFRKEVPVSNSKEMNQIILYINTKEFISISSNNPIVINTIFDSLFEFESFDICSICEWDLEENTNVSFFVWLLENQYSNASHKAVSVTQTDRCGKFLRRDTYLTDDSIDVAYMYSYTVEETE